MPSFAAFGSELSPFKGEASPSTSPTMNQYHVPLLRTKQIIEANSLQVIYTMLQSPHIDKKSKEHFEMEIKKQFLVINTETYELRKKFFWLKRCATRKT